MFGLKIDGLLVWDQSVLLVVSVHQIVVVVVAVDFVDMIVRRDAVALVVMEEGQAFCDVQNDLLVRYVPEFVNIKKIGEKLLGYSALGCKY